MSQNASIKVVRKLGEGTRGNVMLIERGAAKVQYAMKVFKSGEELDKQKICELRKLMHHHIVKYGEIIVYENENAVLMEYCEKGDLAQYLLQHQSTPLKEKLVWEWFTQLSYAMAYFHGMGIIHGNLKPPNVLLHNGELKISDFGAAGIVKKLVSNAAMRHERGTPLYMAPELFHENPRFDKKSDIWSLGCIIYELCARRCAFTSIMGIINQPYKPIEDDYSSALKCVVGEMLQKSPGDRINMEQILNLDEIRQSTPGALKLNDDEESTSKGVPHAEANPDGFYPQFQWQEQQWKCILQKEEDKAIKLPTLVVKKGAVDVKIDIEGKRWENDLLFNGRFLNKDSEIVSPLNVHLKLSLTFTKHDNTQWTVDKKISATVSREMLCLFKFPNVPFNDLSSVSAPIATIFVKILPDDQNWFWHGLEPLCSRDGKFDTIDWNALKGTFDCTLQWQQMQENQNNWLTHLPLPPLVLDNVAVCLMAQRDEQKLQFFAKLHPSTPKAVETRDLNFELKLHMSIQNDSLKKQVIVQRESWTKLMAFDGILWSSGSLNAPPPVSISILPHQTVAAS